MNDISLKQLKIVVERAIRPVRASIFRKRKMREELLAHLVSIFEDERSRSGDDATALDYAKARFGDPSALSAELQAAVPRRECLARFSEGIMLFRRNESPLAHAARISASMFASCSIGVGLLLVLILSLRGRLHELARMEFATLGAGTCFAAIFFATTLLGHGIRQSLFSRTAPRSFVRASVYIVLSALVVPVSGFLLVWTMTGDPALGWTHFRFLWWSVFVAPVVMVVVVWKCAEDYRDDNEWASLQIEE
jgi:ATP-dependent Clp protease ATP-binding subunit ClpC